MNCLEFRRQIAITPRQLDARARGHREACPRCAEAQQRALVLEGSIDRALAIPVPAHLADQIILRQLTSARAERHGRGHMLMRIAAGVALSLGVATVSWLALAPTQSLAASAVEHLSHEPLALAAHAPIPEATVRAVFARVGNPLGELPGELSYLRICVLGKHNAIHMVMQKPAGAVTVMFVPGAAGRTQDIDIAGVRVRELAFGQGALLLMADSDQDFDQIQSQFGHALAAETVQL
ncbi:MAG: DUF3379 family protein [Lysobacterales bacterium]